MSDPQFQLTDGESGHRPVVNASGDIDLANVDEFQEVMTAAVQKAASSADVITVDLSRVSYCDSAAVRALFSVAASTTLHLIVRSTGPIKTLLSVSGLDRVATVTTVDE